MTDFNPANESPAPALAGRVAKGAAWIMVAGLAARLLGTVNTIVVARLLAPDDIAIVAVATITMQLLHGFSDIGVSQAVVKFQKAGRRELDTLFTFSICRGFLLGLLLVAAAPFARDFLGDPRFFWAFLGIAAFPVITGFLNPRFYEFERELRFSREFLITVLNKTAGVIVSLGVAIYFKTYWAIILGLLTGGIVQVILSYAFRPYLPRIGIAAFRDVFGFTGWLTGVSFMAALNNKLDVPILARIAGGTNAGIFFMGAQLSEMVTAQIALPLTRAIYPGLSSMQDQATKMKAAFLRGVEALGMVAMPAAFGFSFIAADLTILLLGEKWSGAIPVIQIIAPVIGVRSLFYATQSYAIAMGKTRLVFFRELGFFCVRFPVFVWAALEHGLLGAVIATAVLGGFHTLLNLALYARISGGHLLEPLLAARRPIGGVVTMAAYFLFVRPEFSLIETSPLIVRLMADITAGALIYAATVFAFWRASGRPVGVETVAFGALSRFATSRKQA